MAHKDLPASIQNILTEEQKKAIDRGMMVVRNDYFCDHAHGISGSIEDLKALNLATRDNCEATL